MNRLRLEEAVQIFIVLIGAGAGVYCGWRFFDGFEGLPGRTVVLFAFFGAAGGVLANVVWLSILALIEMWREK